MLLVPHNTGYLATLIDWYGQMDFTDKQIEMRIARLRSGQSSVSCSTFVVREANSCRRRTNQSLSILFSEGTPYMNRITFLSIVLLLSSAGIAASQDPQQSTIKGYLAQGIKGILEELNRVSQPQQVVYTVKMTDDVRNLLGDDTLYVAVETQADEVRLLASRQIGDVAESDLETLVKFARLKNTQWGDTIDADSPEWRDFIEDYRDYNEFMRYFYNKESRHAAAFLAGVGMGSFVGVIFKWLRP